MIAADPARRCFSRPQRRALFLVAGGCCTRCGSRLGGTWHAHHRRPHGAGGPTDVINGAALCPPCHQEVHHAHPIAPPLDAPAA